VQRAAGLYGSLIVLDGDDQFKKEPKYAGELGDWYHEPVYAQAAGLERKDDHFQWIGEPQVASTHASGDCSSVGFRAYGYYQIPIPTFQFPMPKTLLINGKGQFGCTLGDVVGEPKCDRKDGERVEAACDKRCGDGGKESEAEKKVVCEDEKAASCAVIRRSECGPFCNETQCGPVVFDVVPGRTYRLRIASTTSLSALNVQVQGVSPAARGEKSSQILAR